MGSKYKIYLSHLNYFRVYLKNYSCNLYVTICEKFCTNKDVIMGYGNQIQTKYTAK